MLLWTSSTIFQRSVNSEQACFIFDFNRTTWRCSSFKILLAVCHVYILFSWGMFHPVFRSLGFVSWKYVELFERHFMHLLQRSKDFFVLTSVYVMYYILGCIEFCYESTWSWNFLVKWFLLPFQFSPLLHYCFGSGFLCLTLIESRNSSISFRIFYLIKCRF